MQFSVPFFSWFAIIKTNAAEIESIVRRVLATLANETASLSDLLSPAVSPATTLSLSDNVISVLSLKDRLRGMRVLEIAESSLMTPAARDYCKELGVKIVRGINASLSKRKIDNTGTSPTRPQRLLIAGTPLWMPAIAKQLCAKQAHVCDTATDDSSALRLIADGLRAGHQAGVAIVHSPHAVCWQAARDDRLRPAVAPNWPELNDILREVPVNLLILSTKTWNVPSVCNTVRHFFQHLQNQS